MFLLRKAAGHITINTDDKKHPQPAAKTFGKVFPGLSLGSKGPGSLQKRLGVHGTIH
jgi:hypothetical protein